MHVAVALVKARQKIATIDLDSRQRSLTHYVENRRTWGERIGRELEVPRHLCLDAAAGSETETCGQFVDAVDRLAQDYSFIVIDTPGHDGSLSRLAHSMADTLITPLNDSFVDFDVLGTVDPETFAVSDISHYAKMVQEVRRHREQHDGGAIDWIVMRNRLSMLGTRNKRLVGVALQELSRRLEFRAIEGFAERMIFREFYPRGLTALDDFDEVTLGTWPTMSGHHGAPGGGEPAKQPPPLARRWRRRRCRPKPLRKRPPRGLIAAGTRPTRCRTPVETPQGDAVMELFGRRCCIAQMTHWGGVTLPDGGP